MNRQPYCSSTSWSFILSPFLLVPSRDFMCCNILRVTAASPGGRTGNELLTRQGAFLVPAPCCKHSVASLLVHHLHLTSSHTPIDAPSAPLWWGQLTLDPAIGGKDHATLSGWSAKTHFPPQWHQLCRPQAPVLPTRLCFSLPAVPSWCKYDKCQNSSAIFL